MPHGSQRSIAARHRAGELIHAAVPTPAARRSTCCRGAASSAGVAAGALGFGGLVQPAAARQLDKAQKRVLVVWLVRRRQPARNLGPQARHRHRRPVPDHPHLGARHPHLRAAAVHRPADAPPGPGPRHQHRRGRPRQGRRHHAHRPAPGAGACSIRTSARSWPSCSARDDNPLPGYIHVTPGGGGGFDKQDAAFLGPRYASVTLGDGKPPANLLPARRPDRRPPTGSATTSAQRLNDRFLQHAPHRRDRGLHAIATTRPPS